MDFAQGGKCWALGSNQHLVPGKQGSRGFKDTRVSFRGALQTGLIYSAPSCVLVCDKSTSSSPWPDSPAFLAQTKVLDIVVTRNNMKVLSVPSVKVLAVRAGQLAQQPYTQETEAGESQV